MGEGVNKVKRELEAFRKKFYLNLLFKGVLLSLFFLVSYLILASVLEYTLWLNSFWRALLLIVFFGLVIYAYFSFLSNPVKWFTSKRGLSEEESANLIGSRIPGVKDKLLNLIQLISISDKSSLLAQASIAQRSAGLENVDFTEVVDLRENLKYLRFLAFPVLVVLALLAINAAVLTDGTSRIVQFNKEFIPQAPFSFNIQNNDLRVFRNEDFNLVLKLEGLSLPDRVLLVSGKRVLKMESRGKGEFGYIFSKVQEPITFQFEAAGYKSNTFQVSLMERPELIGIKAELNFPAYLQRKTEQINNAGNLLVPEGTEIKWNIEVSNATSALMVFGFPEEKERLGQSGKSSFSISKSFKESKSYSLLMENEQAKNKEEIIYQVEVIKDQYPQISASILKDSIASRFLVIGGEISDDYGLTDLKLNYEIQRRGSQSSSLQKSIAININKSQLQQAYYLFWPIDSLKLSADDRLSYYVQVWDNDGVNGRKSSKTAIFQVNMPNAEEIKADISKSQAETEQSIGKSQQKASELKKNLEDSNRELKGKQNLTWEDKKLIEDLLQQQEDLNKMLREVKEKNKALEDKKQALTELDEKLREKAEQLQKLLDELLDDKTRKLFEELNKLMEQNADPNRIQKQLEEMLRNQKVLEKTLERTKELFKRLQHEYKVSEVANELQNQIDRQEELLEKTTNKENPSSENKGEAAEEQTKSGDENVSENADNQEIADEQAQLKEDFKAWEKNIEELEKEAQELRMRNNLPAEEDMENVEQKMEQSKEQLQQNNSKKAKETQQQTIQKMQEMKEQMAQQQSGMEMEMDMENLESMRHILHDLVKLSFDQEVLLNEFTEVRQSDPRFVALSQEQLKLQDDFKIISDSLQALSKRMFQLDAFLPREIEAVNANLDKSMYELRERRKANAVQAMRFTMTSMNNLALLFDDMMQAMMEAMANAKPSAKGKGKKGNQQNISELQRILNEQINELREGGKEGREQSEELARLAAEQERIRRAFQEMQEKMKQEGGELPGNELPGKMEQTELDLVNKQITEMTIRRQQEILTRMLESEKAMREKELDEERKGETANPYEDELPKAFEEYLRLKEKELELLKTVPPKLFPYYKREVGEYFKRIGND
jgi:hypothetical protein